MDLIGLKKDIASEIGLKDFCFVWDGSLYADLPCWGPMPRIVGDVSSEAEDFHYKAYELDGHLYDAVILFAGNQTLTWSQMGQEYGGRFLNLQSRVLEAIKGMDISTRNDILNTKGVFLIPVSVFNTTPRVELMAFAMYVREINRIRWSSVNMDYKSSFRGFLAFGTMLREGGFQAHLISSVASANRRSSGWTNKYGHLPWPSDLSFPDMCKLLGTAWFNREYKHTYEWGSGLEDFDGYGGGSWSDCWTYVWDYMTPKNPILNKDLVSSLIDIGFNWDESIAQCSRYGMPSYLYDMLDLQAFFGKILVDANNGEIWAKLLLNPKIRTYLSQVQLKEQKECVES
jgi:hypothetical protein